jgi:hypothetical protein
MTTLGRVAFRRGYQQSPPMIRNTYMQKSFGPLLILILLVAALSSTTAAAQSLARTHCGVDSNQPWQRAFANTDEKQGWREYRKIGDIPEVALGSSTYAYLWLGPNNSLLIRIEEPTEDFAIYSDYCLDRAGRLVQLKFEVRTAWGWGYREERSLSKGLSTPETSEFFSTQTEQPIPRPEMADDIPEALRPRLYKRKSQLPFAKLLSR